jgi:RNA-directed DNA polymerase
MKQVGLRPHPDKTKIVYCQDGSRHQDYQGPVTFDVLGYTFRARAVRSRHGEVFTGFGPAVSGKALARMSEVIAAWNLKSRTGLTWRQRAQWIGPVVRGWMSCYGRFYRSELYPLLARINFHIQQWARAKYRRLRPHKALLAAWETARSPATWY